MGDMEADGRMCRCCFIYSSANILVLICCGWGAGFGRVSYVAGRMLAGE